MATMKWSCHRANQSLEQTVLYMLRRRNGNWEVDRAIQGAIGVMASASSRRLTNVAADERAC